MNPISNPPRHPGNKATRSLLLILPGYLMAWAIASGIEGKDVVGKERKYQQEQARIDLELL